MGVSRGLLNPALAAIFGAGLAFSAAAQDAGALLDELAQPDTRGWQRLERQIIAEWSKSGSAAMDLLLQRGREAMAEGDYDAAVEHLTALVDHAPDFAEGWNARATAHFESDLFGPAMHDLARTLALNPDHFGALTGLGVIMEETGQYERALEAYRAANAIHPHQPIIRRSLERMERRVAGRDA